MAYRLLQDATVPTPVRRLTFVPFLPSGQCVAVLAAPAEPRLPSGPVAETEDWLLHASLRLPLLTAGYRRQRARAFAADGEHVYAWLEGDRYTGSRPHATVDWVTGAAADIAARLAAAGRKAEAQAVRDGERAHQTLTESDWYADSVRLLEPAYLVGATPQEGSGFSGDDARWRDRRAMIVEGIHRDGSFLDLGCANGLLMESVHQWAADRGHAVEPYGVDLAPGLVALARSRLPQWADRISLGNAVDYRPAGGQRFTFVHTELSLVPLPRRATMVRHLLGTVVAPGGRLLVSYYQADGGTDATAAEHLRALGFAVAGQAHSPGGGRAATTAWLEARPG